MKILLAFLIALLPLVGRAQQPGFFIDIEPASGPPGATVVITGRAAPPNTLVRVLYAPYSDRSQCRAGRDAQLVAEVRANRAGAFVATHLTSRLSDTHVGNTYLAELVQAPPRPTSDLECFDFSFAAPGGQFFPETGYSVGGRFLSFWQQNGGLPVFGFPLGPERTDQQGRTVQRFERARFELFPENQPPYDVQLGRLGVEVLEQRGIDWWTQPTAPGAADGCLYFEATRHNVCNQRFREGFLDTWASNGLEFDGQPGTGYAESLALFGFPITEPFVYTNNDGDTVQVQWFERARFEWHPDNPAPFRVLLGRLGAELE